MTTAEERMKILNMVAEGKISAEEGAKLLKVLKQSKSKNHVHGVSSVPGVPSVPGIEPRFLRVRVMDLRTGKMKVNVSLPIGLIDVGLRMGARFVPDMVELDVDEITEAIREGMRGKIIDVEDTGEGEHVEVFLE